MSFPLRTKHFYIPCYFAKEISLHELEFDFIEMGLCSNQLLHAPIRVRLRFDLVNSFHSYTCYNKKNQIRNWE